MTRNAYVAHPIGPLAIPSSERYLYVFVHMYLTLFIVLSSSTAAAAAARIVKVAVKVSVLFFGFFPTEVCCRPVSLFA